MYIFTKIDILKVIFAPLLASFLFVFAVFGFFLPESKSNLMDQKKETIAVLTQTAWNILTYYEKKAQSGEISENMARALAAEQIRDLRYGADGKDYFWITDMQPNMIMHPYRPELEGQNLSNYADPNGKHLFAEFVREVATDGEGYVPYLWQWKDDRDHIAPKLSYVRLFKPWSWITGTGVYVDDVHHEITRISKKLIYTSLAILITILFLSAFIIQQGLGETRKRRAAELELQKYHDNLEDLVKKRTDELQNALTEVKLLSGLLPICASCKKIRDDKGYWNQIESYIQQHSEAEFSHSICPDCIKTLYPKFSSHSSDEEKNA